MLELWPYVLVLYLGVGLLIGIGLRDRVWDELADLIWDVEWHYGGPDSRPTFLIQDGEVETEPPWYLQATATRWIVLAFSCYAITVFYVALWPFIEADEAVRTWLDRRKGQGDGQRTRQFEPGRLYFIATGGSGELACKDCGWTKEITSFIHGFSEPRWGCMGVQCDKCGAFSTIDTVEHEPVPTKQCACGGTFQREEPLFCPQCRSGNLHYALDSIT